MKKEWKSVLLITLFVLNVDKSNSDKEAQEKNILFISVTQLVLNDDKSILDNF